MALHGLYLNAEIKASDADSFVLFITLEDGTCLKLTKSDEPGDRTVRMDYNIVAGGEVTTINKASAASVFDYLYDLTV